MGNEKALGMTLDVEWPGVTFQAPVYDWYPWRDSPRIFEHLLGRHRSRGG
ncbi:hypothetical protein ACFLT5_03760 [Chloroflexota bacterium]